MDLIITHFKKSINITNNIKYLNVQNIYEYLKRKIQVIVLIFYIF